MIRIIVEVESPDPDIAKPGQYKTFDVICQEMETFLSANGLKGLLGYEIRQVAAVVPIKKEEKPDPDALPKGADALTTYKHKKALEVKAAGKLPPKLKPEETLLEQYKRYTDAQKVESDKESAKNKEKLDKTLEKERAEFNKRVKGHQEAWDRHKYWNTVRRIPRPTKESVKAAEKAEADRDSAAA